MANVFIACPLYDGRLHIGAAHALFEVATRRHTPRTCADSFSLLTANCNRHWVAALNERRSHGLAWFAMLHSDVEPEDWWVDKLIEIADQHGADALSAVVPIKETSGGTSTAISQPGDAYRCFTRMTMAQVNHELFPRVFDIHSAADALERLPEPFRVSAVPREALLVNTGCFLCRLDRDWCERVQFATDDAVVKVGGDWKVGFDSEDWQFCRQIAAAGGKVMATTLVRVKHWGQAVFDSSQTWGAPRDSGR